MKVDRPVIFFDGICNLCNSSINIFLKFRSLEKDFFIASLQGQTAKSLLPLHYLEDPSTIVFHDTNGEIFVKSKAIIEILKLCKKPWCYIVHLLSLIPEDFLNRGYDFIASKRYRWWGKRSQCRLPTESERYIFLP
jgi:predicted DCC family thiol-disulfide oxidoreductase YuxK